MRCTVNPFRLSNSVTFGAFASCATTTAVGFQNILVAPKETPPTHQAVSPHPPPAPGSGPWDPGVPGGTSFPAPYLGHHEAIGVGVQETEGLILQGTHFLPRRPDLEGPRLSCFRDRGSASQLGDRQPLGKAAKAPCWRPSSEPETDHAGKSY